ncbi:hypothetical protein BDZ89DRAFT_1132902 [Hymenopellis radicata]|nr:hypothetical protein BDZ89DRAFT_1132902 [Hymenopellis radicata]
MPKAKPRRVKHGTTPRSSKKYWCDCTNFDCYGGSFVLHKALVRHAKHKAEVAEERRAICPGYVDAPREIQELVEQMTLQSLDTATLSALFTPASSMMYFECRHFGPQLGIRLCDEDNIQKLLDLIDDNQTLLQQWLKRTKKTLRLSQYSFHNITALDTNLEDLPDDTTGFRHLRLQDLTLRYWPWDDGSMLDTLKEWAQWEQWDALEKLRLMAHASEEYGKKDYPSLVEDEDEWFMDPLFGQLLRRFINLQVFALSHPSPLVRLTYGWNSDRKQICLLQNDDEGDGEEIVALDPSCFSDELSLIKCWDHPNLQQVFLFYGFCEDYNLGCTPKLYENLSVYPCGVLSQWAQETGGWRRKDPMKEVIDHRLSMMLFGDFWRDPWDTEPYFAVIGGDDSTYQTLVGGRGT